MTILLDDAKEELRRRGVKLHEDCLVNDFVYADDTLLIDVDSKVLEEEFMECVGAAGQQYGLASNWSKLEVMPVCTQAKIEKPDRSLVTSKPGMVYLGSLLSSDGRVAAELGRRIGQGRADFDTLKQVRVSL